MLLDIVTLVSASAFIIRVILGYQRMADRFRSYVNEVSLMDSFYHPIHVLMDDCIAACFSSTMLLSVTVRLFLMLACTR